MDKKKFIISGVLLAIAVLVFALAGHSKQIKRYITGNSMKIEKQKGSDKDTKKRSTKQNPKPKVAEKTMEEKQAVMNADMERMDALNLHYDYANMTLPQVVQTYMNEMGIDPSAVAFSYKNTATGEIISMNETQPMTAGSTYKLPLNMLIVDQVAEGKLSMDKAYDITKIDYEYEGEYNAYRKQFGDDMTISEMQEYSLVYSENTPAHAMVSLLGGFEKAYSMFDRYGKSKADLKTIDLNSGNKTTTDYYIQVLDHLWNQRDKYTDILKFLGQSFSGLYYKTYLPDIQIFQKPGYVREALNIDAVVNEQTPYLIALYTAGLGGSTSESSEVNDLGYNQLCQLTYVINEWHRVNQNP